MSHQFLSGRKRGKPWLEWNDYECIDDQPPHKRRQILSHRQSPQTPATTTSQGATHNNSKKWSRKSTSLYKWKQQQKRQFTHTSTRTVHVFERYEIVKKENPVFKMAQLLIYIASYLEFYELVLIRGVNSFFMTQLHFNFEIEDNITVGDTVDHLYKIYFSYNNYLIKSLVENTISPKLSNIAAWWLQVQSKKFDNRYAIFKMFLDEAETKLAHSSRANELHLLSFKFNDRTCQYSGELDRYRSQMETKMADKQAPFEAPLPELSGQLAVFKGIRLNIDANLDRDDDVKINVKSKDVGNLVLASYYSMKPLIKELDYCLINNKLFSYSIELAKNRPATNWVSRSNGSYSLDAQYANGLFYLYLGWLTHGAVGYSLGAGIQEDSDDLDRIRETKGRWSMFAQLCLTGNFDYFTKFMENIDLNRKHNDNDKRNNSSTNDVSCDCEQSQKRTYDILMNGMTTMFSLYLRLDLLKSIKYNCTHCTNAFNGLSLATFDFAANATLLKHLRQACENRFFFSGSAINYQLLNDKKHFHPKSRLFYLYNLCFSSKFLIGWKKFHSSGINSRFRQCYFANSTTKLMDHHDNFDTFSKEWELSSFDDIGSDKEKQISIHEKFKVILQFTFGLADKFTIFDAVSGKCKLIDGIVIENGNKGNGYGDIVPKGESDTSKIYQALVSQPNLNEETILNGMQNPQFNRVAISFDAISNLHHFLLRFCDLFESCHGS